MKVLLRTIPAIALLFLLSTTAFGQPEGPNKKVMNAACSCIGDGLQPYLWYLETHNNTLEEFGAEAYTDDRATELMTPEDAERYVRLKSEFEDYISDQELEDCVEAQISDKDMDAFDELSTRREILNLVAYLEMHDCNALALYFKILSYEIE